MLGTPCIAPKLKQHHSEVSLSVEKAEVDNLKNCELNIEGCSVLSQCLELNAPWLLFFSLNVCSHGEPFFELNTPW